MYVLNFMEVHILKQALVNILIKSTSLISGETMYNIWICVPNFIYLIGDMPFPGGRQKNRDLG